MEYGKFNSAEELLKGYNQLEKSFTQKCQQLAELKNSLSKPDKNSTTQLQAAFSQQGNSEQSEHTSLCHSEQSDHNSLCHSEQNELDNSSLSNSEQSENTSLCHSERAKRVEESSNPITTPSGTNEASSPLTTELAADLTGSGNGSTVSTVASPVTIEDKDSAAEENVCAVPADNVNLSAANDSPSPPISPIQQIKQYLDAHPDERGLLLNGSSGQTHAPLPKVMASGGNVSMTLPTKPKTIKEASVLAKKLFEN